MDAPPGELVVEVDAVDLAGNRTKLAGLIADGGMRLAQRSGDLSFRVYGMRRFRSAFRSHGSVGSNSPGGPSRM